MKPYIRIVKSVCLVLPTGFWFNEVKRLYPGFENECSKFILRLNAEKTQFAKNKIKANYMSQLSNCKKKSSKICIMMASRSLQYVLQTQTTQIGHCELHGCSVTWWAECRPSVYRSALSENRNVSAAGTWPESYDERRQGAAALRGRHVVERRASHRVQLVQLEGADACVAEDVLDRLAQVHRLNEHFFREPSVPFGGTRR